MGWNIVVAVIAVVFTVVLWVLFRPHYKHSTPEKKLNFNRIMFISAIITFAVVMWWTSTH